MTDASPTTSGAARAKRDTEGPESEPIEDPGDLLTATNVLSRRVAALSVNLDVSARQARHTRIVGAVVALVVMVVAVFGYRLITEVSQATKDNAALSQANTDNQTQNCLNANESRAGSLALWTTVLNYVKASASNKDREQLDSLQTWINALYAPRDCSDLSKTYTVPPPPILVG